MSAGYRATRGVVQSYSDEPVRLVRLKYPPIMRANIGIAFACPGSYLFDILNVDSTTAVRDHPSLVQLACHLRHAGTPHPDHLGQKFLRQREIGPNELVHSQEPLAGASLNSVDRIAGSSLLHL